MHGCDSANANEKINETYFLVTDSKMFTILELKKCSSDLHACTCTCISCITELKVSAAC